MRVNIIRFMTGSTVEKNGDIFREGACEEGRAWMVFPKGYSGYMPTLHEQAIVHWTPAPWYKVIVHKCEPLPQEA